jgi:hypothetical protein
VANYRSGGTGASVDAVAQVVSRTGASARWLLLGDAPPLGPEDPSSEFDRGVESVLVDARRWLAVVEERFASGRSTPVEGHPRGDRGNTE